MTTMPLLNRYARDLAAAAAISAFCLSIFAAVGSFASAEPTKEEIALQMATLLRSARAVVSENQGLINNPDKGDKGFTGEVVLLEAKFNFLEQTGIRIDKIDPTTLQGQLLKAEMEAIIEIVDEWQDVINEKGVDFKGFLPAIFAFQVTERFGEKKGDIADLKLTAPADYVRNDQNMPDIWEQGIIEEQFRAANHPLGQHVAALGEKDGKQAFRLILPEYYTISCLGCHGQPKGAIDKTGGKKEGGGLGELGGAISVVLYEGAVYE